MVCCLLKSLSWWTPAIAQESDGVQELGSSGVQELSTPQPSNASTLELPCLNSSVECLAELTELAIAHNLEIQSIDERLVLGDDRITFARRRRWTNYITTDPIRLIQNILGGGDVQRDRLDIAELELRQADLVRRRWEVTEAIASDVVDLVLEWESLDRKADAMVGQLQTQQQREAVMEAAYRTGSGRTTSMLSVWQRTEDLEARLIETQIDQNQIRQELERVVYEVATTTGNDTSDSDRGDRPSGMVGEPER